MSSSAPVTPSHAARHRRLSERATLWLIALALAAWSVLLRLWRLGDVKELIFDEVYYVRDAYTLMREGVEHDWAKEGGKEAFQNGQLDAYLDQASYVVHPSVGKWVIAAGEAAVGANHPMAWRLSVALVGTLSIVILFLTVRRLLGNTTLALMAGFLLSIDGMHLTHSRTGLLDLILMLFVLIAFYFLVLDRDQFRSRLAKVGEDQSWRVRGVRWWRLAAGVSLGLACGVKWSGLFFIAVFGLLTVAWDWWARRHAGDPKWFLNGLFREAVPAFFAMVGTAAIVYLASWAGWFASTNGYYRHWAEKHGWADSPAPIRALVSLWHYHQQAYAFHVSLSSKHSYEADAVLWLPQLRPTNFYYRSYEYGQMGCTVEKCSQAILNLGNPVIWWSGCLALLVTLFAAVWWRDGRAAWILSGILAGYVPWLAYPERTIFQFYSIAFEPWLILAIVYCWGLALGGAHASKARRYWVGVALGSFLMLTTLVSAFFWPVWTAEVIPYEQWRWRMWLQSWI